MSNKIQLCKEHKKTLDRQIQGFSLCADCLVKARTLVKPEIGDSDYTVKGQGRVRIPIFGLNIFKNRGINAGARS